MDELDPVTREQVAEFHRRLERNARRFQEAAALIAANNIMHASLSARRIRRRRAGVSSRIRLWLSAKASQRRKRQETPENEPERPTITIIDANSK